MADLDSVVFVTSGGNNGTEKFHVKKIFTNNDTISTGVGFDLQSNSDNYWGQTITLPDRQFFVKNKLRQWKIRFTFWHIP